jgi:hypothetical protein
MIKLQCNIKCPNCEAYKCIDLKDYVVDESTCDREMGMETEYTIEECKILCDECGQEFEVTGSIWEYPEGCENENTLKAKLVL